MPLIIDGNQIPTRWLERSSSSRVAPIDNHDSYADYIRIALINNMPDTALEDTELQLFDLLDTASGNVPILLRLYSLAGVPRSDRGMRHLNSFYRGIGELWDGQVDAVIVTGTEPHHADLRQEPYWSSLASLMEWAERNTVSTILSCLAAHAGVLHSDGIERHRLSDKQFGVFEFANPAKHQLTCGAGERVRFPHSRWNEVQSDELAACGYQVLTQSAEGGVDSFVKMKRGSLFVHFQGHPEYFAETLLKEYRRDIKRFLRKERETYPSMPQGYFDARVVRLLTQFRQRALHERVETNAEGFPEMDSVVGLQRTWQVCSVAVYRNWLQYVTEKRAQGPRFMALASTGQRASVVTGTDRLG